MKRSAKKIELPEAFAEQILQCQIQYKMSSTPSQATIRKLLQLYAIGVEHYQSIKSPKYIYFQIKMGQIFKDIEKWSKYTPTGEGNWPQQNISNCTTKTPKNKKLANFIQARDHKVDKLSNMDLVKRIINESSLKNIETGIILQKQLQMQDQKLKEKLQRRKQKTMQKCLSETSAGLSNDMSSRSSIDIESHLISVGLQPLAVSFADIITENQFDDQDIQKRNIILKVEEKLDKKL